MNLKEQEKHLDDLLELLEIDFYSDEVFVLCGSMNDYENKEGKKFYGYNSMKKNLIDKVGNKVEADKIESILHSHEKERIGNKFYTYEKAIELVKKGFCSKIGLWIPKGYIVVDVDTEEDSKKMIHYIKEHEINTSIIKTKKGYHLLFKYDGTDIKNSTKNLTKAGFYCDYRTANNGYIVLPFNDINRRIVNLNNIEYIKAGLFPEENTTRKLDLKQTRKDKDNNAKAFAEGKRNESLFKSLCKFAKQRTLRNFDSLMCLAIGMNFKYCNPPLEESELETIVASVINNYTLPEYMDENGKINPALLAEHILKDKKVKHCFNNDYLYNGFFYEQLGEMYMQNTILKYLPVENQKTTLITECLKLLRIKTIADKKDLEYICCNNGLVNVRSLNLIKHTDKIFTTFKIDCDYKENVSISGSRFEQYLLSTFENDVEIINVVQEVLGASLLPNPKLFKKVVFLLGEGSNGKSTLMNIIKKLNGDDVSAVEYSKLSDRSSGRFALQDMAGKKTNIDDDASGSRIEESANIKKIATGGEVCLEPKGKTATYETLNILLVVGLNSMPSSRDKSYGYIRRQAIIPFNVTFGYGEGMLPADDTLESDILDNEMDIVLSFALEGLQRLLRNNYRLTESRKVIEAQRKYQLENNSALAFVEANKEGSPEDLSAKKLYTMYENWCTANEQTPLTQTRFGRELAKVYSKEKNRQGIIYKGVRVLNYK